MQKSCNNCFHCRIKFKSNIRNVLSTTIPSGTNNKVNIIFCNIGQLVNQNDTHFFYTIKQTFLHTCLNWEGEDGE